MSNARPIKNYTTQIAVEKTIGEIETILAQGGVSRVAKEYDTDGVFALTFCIRRDGNDIPFRMPIRVASVKLILEQERRKGRLPAKLDSIEQARRIGWRILKDWTDAQMALVQIGMVKMEEVFMPYLFSYANNLTLFEHMETAGISGFLEAPKKASNQ